jgi:hypothetical protein
MKLKKSVRREIIVDKKEQRKARNPKYAFMIIIVLALVSMTGYVILTQMVTAGAQRIVEGQLELEKGQKMLAEGKAKLVNGKRQMSGVNQVSGLVNDIPFMGIVEKMPISSQVMSLATNQIKEGNELIAKGEMSVKNGEKRFEEGKLQLSQGKQHLVIANRIRMACACAAVFFGSLAIGLVFYWRRTEKVR